jgi:inner membrane transporter RhtA
MMVSPASSGARSPRGARTVPPHVYFIASAIFRYLGPAFAVLLFARIEPLGVAWLRIASAAVVFALWRRPWRCLLRLSSADRRAVIALGVVLALMNIVFYLAIERLPLSAVGAIEFMGPIGLAAFGTRTARNGLALIITALGVYLLTNVRIQGEPVGYLLAFANCGLFVLYIVLGHRIAASSGVPGLDRLGMAMLIAVLVALPVGILDAMPALVSPLLLAAAIGVGLSSSVVPYVCDQLAMARLPRSTFALLLALLPATAAMIGVIVLQQIPAGGELVGVGLVIVGVAIHRPD